MNNIGIFKYLYAGLQWWHGVVVNALVVINEVIPRRTWLELGWVTVCRRPDLGM